MAVYSWNAAMNLVMLGQFDFTQIGEFIIKWSPSLRDFIIMVVSIVGACTAKSALNTWQRQLRGSTEYELSRRILKSIYRVRDSIRMVRNPLMMQAEIEAASHQLTEIRSSERAVREDTEAITMAYNLRWGKLIDTMRELEIECLESEVFWGRRVSDLVRPLHNAINDLHRALRMHLRDRNGQAVYSPDEVAEIERTVFGFAVEEESDVFANRVQAAITTVENFLRPNLISNR
jgi:hypothetical protein